MRRALGAAAGTLAFAAVVAGSSLTAASASTSSMTEHFQFMSASAFSPRASAIARGVFTAGGTINVHTGLVQFRRGTFRAIHHRTSAVNQFSRKTCLLVAVEHGTYRLADGTGRYRHISGRGTYTSRVWAVFRRNARGRCSQSKPPRAYQQVINARGPVRGVSRPVPRRGWQTPARTARKAG